MPNKTDTEIVRKIIDCEIKSLNGVSNDVKQLKAEWQKFGEQCITTADLDQEMADYTKVDIKSENFLIKLKLLQSCSDKFGDCLATKRTEKFMKDFEKVAQKYYDSLKVYYLFLLSTGSQTDDTIDCLNGIRIISMVITVATHTSFDTRLIAANVDDVRQLEKTFWLQSVMNFTHSVDIFFLVSGFLNAYGIIKWVNKTGRLPTIGYWLIAIAKRYIRITPSVLAFIWATIAGELLFTGRPLWHLLQKLGIAINLLTILAACTWIGVVIGQNGLTPTQIKTIL
ncbi:uncharacterized protein LOC128953099 [Oppia nitens]|uniref:uncharacterized protein LOC128953099 n=1 Tax=Oppia nitens TaxID=1686743 RepID=UPI0023DB508E|nr:uncharacterized protein LOC128953099 [Oppia nitens]